jgi:outer membrane protein OmpA-like peptidoglycan-associated protein
MNSVLSPRVALAAASLTLALAGAAQAADAPFVLAQSAAHKLKVFADGGAGWCAAHLKLRMVLDADSPDAGNPAAQIDMLNRLKTPIAADCAKASDADVAVLVVDKAAGTYKATKAGGWVFAATGAPAAAAAKQPASLDTPEEQAAGAPAKAAAPAAAAPAPAAAKVPATQPGDVAGSHDPAFLKRYEGSQIVKYTVRPFDRYLLAQLDSDKPDPGWKFGEVEGQITRIIYLEPAGHGMLEMLRNYQQGLSDAGFTQTLELSRGIASRQAFMDTFYTQGVNADDNPLHKPFYDWNKNVGFVAAKGQQDGKDVNVSIFFNEYNEATALTLAGNPKPVQVQGGQVLAIVDVVVSKPIEIKMVQVKASDMADALATKGTVDIYGILFDVDKTDIKPESTKTLDEVASLLKIDRSLKLEIAGHTDNTGSKEHNMTLSEGRAKAVVDALVQKYGIEAERLQAAGYGDTKPVAGNDTEDGRAKNRRVELRKI